MYDNFSTCIVSCIMNPYYTACKVIKLYKIQLIAY